MISDLTIDRNEVTIFGQRIERPQTCGVVQWLEFWEHIQAFDGRTLETIEEEAYDEGYDAAEKEHAKDYDNGYEEGRADADMSL